MADPVIDLKAADARAKVVESRPPPPADETAEARARRIMAEPEEEAATEAVTADPDKGNDQSSIRVRASFDSRWSGATIDTPQPSETLRTVDLGTSGDSYSRIDPVTSVHISVFPGKQPLLYRFGAYASYRRLRATREDQGYHQTTDVDMIGIGFTAMGGPAISPMLEGVARTLLSWNNGKINIGFIGGQASLGFAVSHVDLDVARPHVRDAHERGGEWAISAFPLYGEFEAILAFINLGDENKPWGQITLGLDNYFYLKGVDRPTGGFRDFWLGERTADGNFKAKGFLQPTLGVQLFW